MGSGKMKVVALGGCGGMGQFAVRTAIEFDFVDEIVIADRDGERARSFASEFKEKAKPVELDITDSEALKKVLTGADVVMATVGPYYKFGVPILRAAVDCGCHYLDINDDWESTLGMLELDEAAQKAGITAIIGMGASPGLSNLMAKKAMSRLDTVDEVVTAWGPGDMDITNPGKPGEGGSFSAATEHLVQQMTGSVRAWQDGKYADVAPMREVQIDYPGKGQIKVYTVGHPEPITLPLYRPEIKNSFNAMEMPAPFIETLKWIAAEVDAKRLSVLEASDLLLKLEHSPSSFITTSFGRKALWFVIRGGLSGLKTYLPMLCAVATGEKDGKKKTVAVSMSSRPRGHVKRPNMGGVTGVPLATALSLFHSGKIERRGVSAPERAIDPDTFFDALAPLCTPELKNAEELLEIAVSD